MAHQVFISYSHIDNDIAYGICFKLEEQGIKCWIAPRDIRPGENFAGEIALAIPKCKIMLLILSKSSNASPQVLREVELAANSRLIIIPVRIEEILPTGGMSYYLATTHWIDIKGNKIDGKITLISDRIKDILGVVGDNTAQAQEPAVKETKSKNTEPDRTGKQKSSGPGKKKFGIKKIIAIAAPVAAAAAVVLILNWNNFFDKSADANSKDGRDTTAAQENTPTPNPQQKVEFEDEKLKTDIISALQNDGYTVGDYLTVADMQKLKSLRVFSSGENDALTERIFDEEGLEAIRSKLITDNGEIKSLDGLQYAINLEDLMICGQSIRDLTPLSGLNKLRYLDLTNNMISDITALNSLTDLETLLLSNNLIVDLTPLESIVSLRELALGENLIENIQPLKKLASLEGIALNYNNVSDISALADMRYLYGVVLRGNNIEDISALSYLRKARWLMLDENNITDISALSGLDELNSVTLDGNKIDDISVLCESKSLGNVRIDNYIYNKNSDTVEALRENGCGVDVYSAEGLSDSEGTPLYTPEDLGMSPDTLIEISDPLLRDCIAGTLEDMGIDFESEGFTIGNVLKLETLVITTSHAEKVGALGDVENYMNHNGYDYCKYITDDSFDNLGGLEYAKNLKCLVITEQDLEDISALEGLNRLEAVYLQDNFVSDTEPLWEKFNLRFINLSGNPIKNIGFLEHSQEKLEYLYLFGCGDIGDYRVLSTLSELKVLDVSNSGFQSFDSIENLKNLEALWLVVYEGDGWESLDKIESAGNIEILMLTGSSVTDLDFLESYAGLRELNLEGTDVKDIEVLANLKNLTNLSLLDSNVEDISPLADLALQELYIDQNVYDNNAITVEKLNVTGCNVFTHTK